MRRGEHMVVDIDALSAGGDGIAHAGGREIVVPRTVPGDTVEVCLKRKRRGRFEAEVLARLRGALPRREPACAHFGLCGGCRWQDLDYAHQLQLKERMVAAALARLGVGADRIRPVLPSPEPLFYRNKMEFSFGADAGGALQLGLHLRGRFDRVFELERCHLQSENSNRILQAVRRHARAAGLSVYDLKTHEGLLRFLVVREGKRSGQILVNLVVAAYPCAAVDRLAGEVLKEVPAISVFAVTLHQGRAQVASGQAEYILKGAGHIVEECGGLQFEISSQSFFQTNSLQAERLGDILKELAAEARGGKVLDLYCGTGGMGLCLAAVARHVLGVEVAAAAVEDARRNAARNGIDHCDFVAGPAEEVLEGLCAAGRGFDLVVADPPRAGMHRRVLAALGSLGAPALIYVSCNLLSLVSDLETLGAQGYAVELVQPLDMFPQTPHCELVVRLRRGGGEH